MTAVRVLLAWLLLSAAAICSGQSSREAISMDEFGAVFMTSARAQLVYKSSRAETSTELGLKEYSTSSCADFFAFDLMTYVFVDGAKALPIDMIKKKLGHLDLAATEKDLQMRCKHIETAGKARTIISASIATLENQPRTKAIVDQAAKELNQSKKELQIKSGRQIDLIGIVPGISKKVDVDREAHSKQPFCNEFCLEIGGYDLMCVAEYDGSETLSMLTCWFGGRKSNGDNTEIFNTLKSGFSAKLGKPVMDRKFQVRNTLGTAFDGEDLRWRDESGNTLELKSPVERIDQGALAIKSATRNLQQRLEDEKKRKERRF